MKIHKIITLNFLIISTLFAKPWSDPLQTKQYQDLTDTIPDICSVLPAREIDSLQLFTTPLSQSFPDPNALENYSGCHYQFFTTSEKPQLAVRLIRWASKKEAAVEYTQQVQSHFDLWGLAPERIPAVADSAFFGFNADDTAICDECVMVAAQGQYVVYISTKGQYEKVSRARKKMVALQILKMMYDRIPGLAPSRLRNRQ